MESACMFREIYERNVINVLEGQHRLVVTKKRLKMKPTDLSLQFIGIESNGLFVWSWLHTPHHDVKQIKMALELYQWGFAHGCNELISGISKINGHAASVVALSLNPVALGYYKKSHGIGRDTFAYYIVEENEKLQQEMDMEDLDSLWLSDAIQVIQEKNHCNVQNCIRQYLESESIPFEEKKIKDLTAMTFSIDEIEYCITFQSDGSIDGFIKGFI